MRPLPALVALVTLAGLAGAGLLLHGLGAETERGNRASHAARPPEEAPVPPPAPALTLPRPLDALGGNGTEAVETARAVIEGSVRGPRERLADLEVLATPLGAGGTPRVAALDGEGRFALAALEPRRRYDLRAIPVGRASEARARSQPLEVVAGTLGVELVLVPEGGLRFQVVDAQDGAAIQELEVRFGRGFLRPLVDADGKRKETFPNGRVHLAELFEARAGEPLELEVHARGYRTERRSDLFVPRGGELDLGTLRLTRVPRLVVTVLDEHTDAPIPGALVRLAAEAAELAELPQAGVFDPYQARTDAQGRVRLTSLACSEAALRVQVAGRSLETKLRLLPFEEQAETVRLRSSK
jgi:hypothetical protein